MIVTVIWYYKGNWPVKDIKHVAIMIHRKEDLWEGSRSVLGLAIESFYTYMFVLDTEIIPTEEYLANLKWLDDLEGQYFSNNKINTEKYGFQYLSTEEIGEKLQGMDLIIPF